MTEFQVDMQTYFAWLHNPGGSFVEYLDMFGKWELNG